MTTSSSPSALQRVGLTTAALVAANVGLYLLQALSGQSWVERSPTELLAWGGNLALLSLTGELWRLGSSVFLHGGLLHLAMNMYMLWLIGPAAQRQLGRSGLLLVFLAGGWAASCASSGWFGWHLLREHVQGGSVGHWMVVSAGASGAIMAVCGALLSSLAWQRLQRAPSRLGPGFGRSLGQVVLINLVAGSLISGVDQSAHIGGLLAGGLMGALMTAAGQVRSPGLVLALRLAVALLVGWGSSWALLHAVDWQPLQQARGDFEQPPAE
ncbi:MAG TPA: rhomboid family intramembrane serine protease [Ideonella sp.]|uniref:rhomboid family intramembrane serine protease n=1 Tax=Ideonella sp. TaxID=1929293 RepID=UPI002C6068D4|nr:rhomboid family intramembrane serine protease [Ideonella sp.]HSI50236.1 rhomboid family intramembrane serine protease [Ideonella sp.]